MFESALQLIYTIVVPKPSFKVPPSKPDPIYHTASNLPTQYSPFDVSRSQTRLNPATPHRRARSRSHCSFASSKASSCCCSCSCPYDTQNQSLPYHLPGLEFMSPVASSLLLESPARQTPLHSTPKRTPVQAQAQESPTRSKKPRRHSTTSLGSPYVGSARKSQPKSNKENIPPSKFETPPRNPTRRSGSSNDRNLPKRPIPSSPDSEKRLRRSSGRIASYGSGQSFVEALKRSGEDSSSETESEREPSTNPAATTSIQPFTLELSPILEDLAVFDSVGTNLNLSALGSGHARDEIPSKSVKPSLILQRASLALAAPALTLTKPTPELESLPVFEDPLNPLLTSTSPMLTPIPDLHADSISSLSLSPSRTSFLSITHTPSPLPAFPRCTTCGFGFGTGFDLNASMDMLDVSRLPCEMCEGEWERCVGWFGERGFGASRGARQENGLSSSKRFSWFRNTQEQEDGKWKTFSFKKCFSSSFSRVLPKRRGSAGGSMPMPMVTVTRVEEVNNDGFVDAGAQVSSCGTPSMARKIKRFSASTSPTSDARERRRPLSFLDHKKRFSGLFAPRDDSKGKGKKEKRYSSVGVQTEGGREGLHLPPACPRVSRESRFIEELGEEEELRDAMDALPPLRWSYL